MDERYGRGWELIALLVATLAVAGAGYASAPAVPSSGVNWVDVVGEGAIAVAFLVVTAAVYRFRAALDRAVSRAFVTGFGVLYLSALQDFADEIVSPHPAFTYVVELGGGVAGAACVAAGFGLWVRRYEDRGRVLTEREEQLRRRNEQLEVLNRIVRHDIRNDLNVVLGMIELAGDHVDGDGRDYLSRAERSAVDGVELTQTVQEFVQALDERGEPELKPLPLRRILVEQVEQTRGTYPSAEVRFEREPDPGTEVLATDMLSSVFRNLLVNAVQHNDKSVREVAVSVATDDETVTVSVADNGPGIADELGDEVFGRGEKGLDSDGTGIGLYLVDRLVTQFGGTVTVRDNEPEGAVFEVQLRRA